MRNLRNGFAGGLALLSLMIAAGRVDAQLPAFPGAEGFAKYVTGGRGGEVLAVTTLEDDVSDPPEGSLRWVLKQYIDKIPHPTVPGATLTIPRPLTVVFRVSGIIVLKGELNVSRDNLTLAGQTAPGDGICFKNYGVTLRGQNIIIRYLRFRPGLDAGTEALEKGIAGLNVENCRNVIVDHCSFGWANEECAIFYDNEYTTVQWCIASEGLYNAGHAKGSRSYCGVWGGQFASYHHNLIAHNRSRTIRFNGARAHDKYALVDYRNNVNYNWGSSGACYGGEVEISGGYSRANMVSNYYKPGPATPLTLWFVSPGYYTEGDQAYGVGRWHLDGNVMLTDTEKTDSNWLGLNLVSIPAASHDYARSMEPFRVEEPLPTETAEEAFQSVLEMAGAVFPKRDTVDARIVYEALSGTASGRGTFGGGTVSGIIDTPDSVGGYPEYQTYDVPDDADADGMDDAWELANGLDPADPEDRNDIHESGYTMLEMYLNGLVEDFTQILPPVVHVKGIDEAYCAHSGPASLTGYPRGGYFEAGPAFTVIGDSAIFTPGVPGDYELKYVYSDGKGYSDSAMDVLTVSPPPEVTISGLDTAYTLSNSYIPLSGSPEGGVWSAGEGTTLTPTGVFKTDRVGEHVIYYTYRDGNGCSATDTARTTVYESTGINTGPSVSGINIFPNPAGDRIRISSPSAVSAVILYNMAGVKLKEYKMPGIHTVPVGDIEEGIYYLHIYTEEGLSIQKLVKL